MRKKRNEKQTKKRKGKTCSIWSSLSTVMGCESSLVSHKVSLSPLVSCTYHKAWNGEDLSEVERVTKFFYTCLLWTRYCSECVICSRMEIATKEDCLTGISMQTFMAKIYRRTEHLQGLNVGPRGEHESYSFVAVSRKSKNR